MLSLFSDLLCQVDWYELLIYFALHFINRLWIKLLQNVSKVLYCSSVNPELFFLFNWFLPNNIREYIVTFQSESRKKYLCKKKKRYKLFWLFTLFDKHWCICLNECMHECHWCWLWLGTLWMLAMQVREVIVYTSFDDILAFFVYMRLISTVQFLCSLTRFVKLTHINWKVAAVAFADWMRV